MLKKRSQIAIIDYGLGNIFSIRHGLKQVGLTADITSSRKEILDADAVILPGVGSFGDAMRALKRLDLVKPLQDIAQSEKPLIGICLGLQLLFTQSYEFGQHKGLDIISGEVLPFEVYQDKGIIYKVPQVCWNRIFAPIDNSSSTPPSLHPEIWNNCLLKGVERGAYMYFVHSFFTAPENSAVVVTTTTYGRTEFCSGVKRENVEAFQFHPERSGPEGLKIYRNLYNLLNQENGEPNEE